MKTTVERLEPTRVKLTVEVEAAIVAKAYDKAAREIAQQVNLPGFRKGKVPRKLLEQRVGVDAIKAQALDDALSSYYVDAIRAEELDVVGQPEIDVREFDDKLGCEFDATVEVRPEFELPDHTGLSVTFPEWAVPDGDVDTQLDEMRDRFSELEDVDRAAKMGDYVTLDLRVEIDGEEIESAHVEDALYEIGSQGVTPKLDDELVGVEAAGTFSYDDALPEDYPEHGGVAATFHVTVKDVREKHLPALDDEFAMTASEFDTLAELRADLKNTLLRRRLGGAQAELRGKVIEAYLANIDVPLPETMVENEAHQRIHQIESQAAQFGMELEQLYAMQDTTEEAFHATAHEQAREAVKAQLVLDKLAADLQVPIAAADLDREIMRHAQSNGMQPEQVAMAIQQQGSLPILIGDVMRRKAIDAIVDAANIEGAPSDELMIELGLKADPNAPVADAEAIAKVEAAIEAATLPVDDDADAAVPVEDSSTEE